VAFSHRGFQELNPQTMYQHNWHIEVIAAALEECRTGRLKRLIINVPPRSLKSHLCSISFPAYLLGHNPAARIVCASYAQGLADNLAGSCRTLMMSKFYRDTFRATRLASTRQAIHDFKTTMNGGRLSTSVGGLLTGRGGDFIIIDDPLKPEEAYSDAQRQAVNDWYDHTLISCLDNKATGCIIVIMQRLHEDDLVGHLSSQPDWKILRFPAIAEQNETHVITTPYGPATYTRRQGEALHPERESLEILGGIEKIQGTYNFNGQYSSALPRWAGEWSNWNGSRVMLLMNALRNSNRSSKAGTQRIRLQTGMTIVCAPPGVFQISIYISWTCCAIDSTIQHFDGG
jgi:hypothetical protein